MTAGTDGPAEVFGEIRRLLSVQAESADVYQALVRATVRLVTGCDHAALMLVDRRGRPELVGASDQVARLVGALELEVREGPCLDAIYDEGYQFDADIRRSSQWPTLAGLVLERTPVRGMVGYRLVLDEEKVGALSLFSDAPGGLDQTSADHGAVLASFAAVAVMTSRAQEATVHLERALESSREIGKAVGLLMAAHKITDDQAFEILRKTSQDLNVRLSALAREVVDGQRRQHERARTPDAATTRS